MSDLETQLDNLDEQLSAYEPKMRWVIYIGTALGILVMGWMFYLTDTLDELSALEEQNSQLVAQINENSPEVFRSKIAKSAGGIVTEQQRGVALENEKQALMLQMASSEGMIFDNRHYAKMLDLLLERSIRLGLKIELMESEDTDTLFYGKIKQFKKLTVTGTGSFPAIADYLAFIESQNRLVQIQSVQIRSDEAKPRFTAVILYMGVAL